MENSVQTGLFLTKNDLLRTCFRQVLYKIKLMRRMMDHIMSTAEGTWLPSICVGGVVLEFIQIMYNRFL
jgi:hypothetical protein